MKGEARLPEGEQPVLRLIPMPADTNAHGTIFGGWTEWPTALPSGKLAYKRLNNARDNLILDGKDIGKVSVEAFCPKMAASPLGIYKLGINANTLRGSSGASFENVAYTKFLCDTANIG